MNAWPELNSITTIISDAIETEEDFEFAKKGLQEVYAALMAKKTVTELQQKKVGMVSLPATENSFTDHRYKPYGSPNKKTKK